MLRLIKSKKIIIYLILLWIFLFGTRNCFAEQVKDYAVMINATVQTTPAKISLSWVQDTDGTPNDYKVYRKLKNETSWNLLATLPGTTLTYEDTNVSKSSAYEYQITRTMPTHPYPAYGYIYVGIEAPLVDSMGKVILLVDNTFTTNLSSELNTLEKDLAGDGWQIIRHDVSRTDSVTNIKNTIKADYLADPANIKAVYLFGHIPVPYSGDINPDGHPDHRGAWPADSYYGDMDGTWTDTTVNDTAASDSRNRNIPGDGKFDQSYIASDIELQVGRVDLSNMSNLPGNPSELDLLRNYLNKEHNFRQKLVDLNRQGLIGDNFGFLGGTFEYESFASSGWRNFSSFFGSNNIDTAGSGAWVPAITDESYLWAYGCGPGNYTSAGGVASTNDIVGNNVKGEFFMLFGSYFGDWDSQDNFLRSPLANPNYGLTDAWSGRPQWLFHHMVLGETIGYGTRLTQNNAFSTGPYLSTFVNYGVRYIHVALMGDPTLRMHIVGPISNLTGAKNGNNVSLGWTASSDSVLGYHVYRSDNPLGPFTRLTGSPIAGTTYTDNNVPSGDHIYMVRAVKMESTNSGSYFNASEGVFWATSGTSDSTPPARSGGGPAGTLSAGTTQTNITLTTNENATCRYSASPGTAYGSMTNTFSTTGTTGHSAQVTGLTNGGTYHYYVRCQDTLGNANTNDYEITFSVENPVICPSAASGAFTGCYYSGNNFDNLVFTRQDSAINFGWSTGSPDSSVPSDNFSARWSGSFNFTGGTYDFTAITDDGMRVSLDGTTILDKWLEQPPTTYAVSRNIAAGTHTIVVEYNEYGGGAVAKLSWEKQSSYSPGDLNQDTKIDSLDLDILKIDFLKLTADLANSFSDIDKDGRVTVKDVGIMMSGWK